MRERIVRAISAEWEHRDLEEILPLVHNSKAGIKGDYQWMSRSLPKRGSTSLGLRWLYRYGP